MRFTQKFFVTLALSLLCACTNMSDGKKNSSKSDTSSGISGSIVTQTMNQTPGYKCPTNDNVVPYSDTRQNGSGYYKACTADASQFITRLYGQTYTSERICVFPAQATSNVYLPNFSGVIIRTDGYGVPVSQCFSIADTFLDARFDNLYFNFVFVTEESNRWNMTQCMLNRNLNQCPFFSHAKFR